MEYQRYSKKLNKEILKKSVGALQRVTQNQLIKQERPSPIDIYNTKEFASLPPEYIASKSSFYRVLKAKARNENN